MEKILSTLILHKKADGADTRFAQSRTPMSEAPSETWLGVLACGAYKKAENDPAWAFVKLDDMRNQEVEHNHDDSSDESDDYDADYNSDPDDDTAADPATHDDDQVQKTDEDNDDGAETVA
jgi:hypothetical protein